MNNALVLTLCFLMTIFGEGCIEFDLQPLTDTTVNTHPAARYAIKLLESQRSKDLDAFASCFSRDENAMLFVNLQGGAVIRKAKELIERHRKIYQSPVFRLSYGELQDVMGNEDVFICSAPVSVTFPNGIYREVTFDMTFVNNNDGDPEWIPVRIINTIVDSGQTVID